MCSRFLISFLCRLPEQSVNFQAITIHSIALLIGQPQVPPSFRIPVFYRPSKVIPDRKTSESERAKLKCEPDPARIAATSSMNRTGEGQTENSI